MDVRLTTELQPITLNHGEVHEIRKIHGVGEYSKEFEGGIDLPGIQLDPQLRLHDPVEPRALHGRAIEVVGRDLAIAGENHGGA